MLLFFIVTWPIISGESIIDCFKPIFSFSTAVATEDLTFGAGNLYNSVRDII
jgi:hypothetical protein